MSAPGSDKSTASGYTLTRAPASTPGSATLLLTTPLSGQLTATPASLDCGPSKTAATLPSRPPTHRREILKGASPP